MTKFVYILVGSLILLASSCSKDEQPMLPTVVDDRDGQYYVWLHNVGALIDNKRPHPNEAFNIFFYFNSDEKDPITKITLLGKVVPSTTVANRYKDLTEIASYSPSDWVYSTYYGADSLYMSWMIPNVTASTHSAYYRIAVETAHGFRDTTAGDYWGVIKPYNIATLSAILVDGKSAYLLPTFSSATYSYTWPLGPTATAVPTVTVTETNASSDVTIVPAASLTGTAEQRTTTITVVSEDKSVTNVYKVTFEKIE